MTLSRKAREQSRHVPQRIYQLQRAKQTWIPDRPHPTAGHVTVVPMQCHHDRTPHSTVCQAGHSIISVYSCQKCVPQPQGDIRGTFSRPELTQEADGQGQGDTEGPTVPDGRGPRRPGDECHVGSCTDGDREGTAGKLVTSESRWLCWAPHFDQWPRRWALASGDKGHREPPLCLCNSLGILTDVLKLPKWALRAETK